MATLVSDAPGAGPGGAAARDAALVAGLRAGRRDAFEQLYELYRARIYNLTLRIVQSPDDASDITQDVFVKAFRKLPDSPVADLHLTPWLYRVAVNASYDHLRTRKLHRDINEVGAESRPALVDTFEQAEMGRRVEQTLAALSERHRTVLVLKDIHGLRHDEIAEILGVSRNATETLLFRARDAFRARYLELTRDQPGARNVEKWTAAGIGIGVFLHEAPLPAALQGGFPFGAAGAGSAAAGGAAGGVGAGAGGAGAATGVVATSGGLLAKAGSLAGIKIAAAVIAATCAAGGGVAAYEAGVLPALHHRPPAHAGHHMAEPARRSAQGDQNASGPGATGQAPGAPLGSAGSPAVASNPAPDAGPGDITSGKSATAGDNGKQKGKPAWAGPGKSSTTHGNSANPNKGGHGKHKGKPAWAGPGKSSTTHGNSVNPDKGGHGQHESKPAWAGQGKNPSGGNGNGNAGGNANGSAGENSNKGGNANAGGNANGSAGVDSTQTDQSGGNTTKPDKPGKPDKGV